MKRISMPLATLQFEMRLQKCIKMGITIFKIFIVGNWESYGWIKFYGSARASPHWLMYTLIWWYLRVLPVLHRPEVVDFGANTI